MHSAIKFLFNIWYAQETAAELVKTHELCVQLNDENAALRSQISQRDASGKFTKKNAS